KKAADIPLPGKPRDTGAREHELRLDADRAVQIYGNPLRASKILQAQIARAADLELPEDQVNNLNRIVGMLEDKAFSRLKAAEKDLANVKGSIEDYKTKIAAITPEELRESNYAKQEKKRFESSLKAYQEKLPKSEHELIEAKAELESWGHKFEEPGQKPV